MFCHKCGKEVKKDANHCPYCGAKLDYAKEATGSETSSGQRKFLLPIVAAVVVILAVLAVRVLFFGGYTLNATDYVSLKVSGLDTEGTAALSFDVDRLLEDIGEKKNLTERQKEKIEALLSDAVKDFSVTKNTQLSNGDEITVESNLNKKLLKEYGATLKNGSVKLTVENLTEIQEVSLNDYIALEFGGFEGSGYSYVNVDWNALQADVQERIRAVDSSPEAETFISEQLGEYLYSFQTELSVQEGISTGDTVSVSISMEKTEIKEYGIRFVWEDFSVEARGLAAKETITLTDYLTFEFYGYEGNGKVSIFLDEEKLSEDLKQMFQEDGRGAYGALTAESDLDSDITYAVKAVRDAWRNSYTTEADQSENLSGGDTLTVTCSENEDEYPAYVEGSFGLCLKGGQTETTVEGLIATETIVLTDYLECGFAGYDGAGTAEVSFAQERLQADLETFFAENGRGAYGALEEDDDTAEEASYAANEVLYSWKADFVTGLDREEALSNGDTVTLGCMSEEERVYLSNLGLYLEGGESEIRVEGLMEPQEIDLADALTVTFTGICPEVYAEVEVDYDLPYVYDTSLTDMYSERLVAENGDTYEGTITYDEITLLKQGYRVINDSYSFTISGLNTYALSIDSIEDEMLLPISEEKEALIRAQVTKDSPDIASALGRDSGWILWSETRTALEALRLAYDEENAQNRLYLIYHVVLPVKELDRSVTEEEVYYTICCYDVEETPDETLLCERSDWGWFLSASEVSEYITAGIGQMGEGTEITSWTNDRAPELLEVSATGDEEVAEPVVPETVQTGEIDPAAKQQAVAELSCEGHTYVLYDLPLTWKLASTYCEKAGGHLATVTSAREKAVIDTLLEDASLGVYWLGATDEEWEGGWQWITGEPFEWTDWYSGQPDNYTGSSEGAENYLQTGRSYGYSWNDCNGTDEPTGFILEIEPVQAEDEAVEAAAGGAAAETGRYLTDLTPVYVYNSGLKEYVQDPYGEDHFYSLYLNASERGMLAYDLNGEWTEFSGTISTWSEAESEAVFEIAIWGDDRLLLSRYDYQKGDAAFSFCVDVTGVQTLSIQTRNRGSQNNGYLFINESRLISDGTTEETARSWVELSALPVIDESGYEDYHGSGLFTDAYGSIHRDGYCFDASEGGYAIWNLGKNYTSLEGLLSADRSSSGGENSVSLEILVDGESVFTADHYDVYQGALPVSVDLTGGTTMEIRTRSNAKSGEFMVYLADTALTAAEETAEAPEEGEEAVAASADGENDLSERAKDGEPEFPEIADLIEQKAAFILTDQTHRYYLFEEALTWQQAKAFCSAAGATLACPLDEEANTAIQALIAKGRQDAYWLGGYASGGRWAWCSEESFGSYLNWADGKPDNYGGEEYLMCMYRNGTWDDYPADAAIGFIMQTEAAAGETTEETVKVSQLEWTEGQGCEIDNAYSCDAQKTGRLADWYQGGIRMNAYDGAWFRVNLEGMYDTFSGTLVCDPEAAENADLQFAVFGDGKLLYERKHIRKAAEAEVFSIDVAGVQVLTVTSSNSGDWDGSRLWLPQANLTAASEKQETMVSRLSELIAVDAVESNLESGLFADAYGELHDGCVELNAGVGSRILYNLNGAYTSISLSATAGMKTALGAKTTLTFYGDGEVLCRIEDFEKCSGIREIRMDLTGMTTLEITAESETENTWIYLTDDQLVGR